MSPAKPETQHSAVRPSSRDHGEAPLRLLGTRVFPGAPEAVSATREYLGTLLAGRPDRGDALLLASEIATNAIRHSRSQGRSFTVEVFEADNRVRVEVKDLGGDGVPTVRDDINAMDGRGLLLLAAIASRWGMDGDEGGRTIWFELVS